MVLAQISVEDVSLLLVVRQGNIGLVNGLFSCSCLNIHVVVSTSGETHIRNSVSSKLQAVATLCNHEVGNHMKGMVLRNCLTEQHC